MLSEVDHLCTGVIPTPAYSAFAGVAYSTDAEGRTRAVYLRPSNLGTSKKAVTQQGTVTVRIPPNSDELANSS